jgi:hypothetical protein
MKKIPLVMFAMISGISASDDVLIDHGPWRNSYRGDPSGMLQSGQDTGYEDGLMGRPCRVTASASERALDRVMLPLNPFLMLGNTYSHGYAERYERGVSDRKDGIVDPETRKVIYCRSKKQIEKQQAPVAVQGKPILPDHSKACGARFAWFCSEVASIGGLYAGYMGVDIFKGHCSYKTLCLLSAAASYPALKEVRRQLGVFYPATMPSSISIPLSGGRTYKVTNPLEKLLGAAGAVYFLSKAGDGIDVPNELFTNFAKASLIGASGYAGRKLTEAAYALKVSREE